ncbi:MAG: 23S rRNA (pseudouridine(1915)-N(3))-methyltransferase RlmH [Candidatus Nomurabacteria bacterium]|nr:MAG: 23S rRNA (pseudouridine(1915)-N(3))-methyltransferase RlmH [Candidatus Nomurabacteria bacterium]
MAIKIIAVGKKHESWIEGGVKHYQDRLKKPFDVEWVLLPHSALSDSAARQDESERILSRLDDQAYVMLLDERGDEFDSPRFARMLESKFTASRQITIVIGGAYGVDDRVHQRADDVWSLSPLVFPHQLVRLILIEQLYRAQQIIAGHPYHHV